LAQLACILEATAHKPGNVHRFRDFDDATYLDFLLSAQAIAGPLDRASEVGVGAAILNAVAATRRLVGTNTNLGMVLLLAPLCAVRPGATLEGVLASTTVEDARRVYGAIRLASPGGLGDAPEQDVAGEPTVTLTEAMRLAAGRDAVARQYINGYAEVRAIGLATIAGAIRDGRPTETAVILAHLRLLAEVPDTLIARKRGAAEADEAARRAWAVLDAGWPDSEAGRRAIGDLDHWLRAEGRGRNPGTTADLVTAALFLALRDGTIAMPGGLAGRAWCPAD
ncbi:MAG: triphosphoribosyl-dephospho-CoA synthase, partial [Thermoleophilia bacterium]|nr:triphosphoribosyl-dephospho-CoA synthase [Thermoleophilia bacterium]